MSMEESSRPGEGTNMSVSVVMGTIVDFQAGPEGFLRALGATCGHSAYIWGAGNKCNISCCKSCCSRGAALGEDDLVFPRYAGSEARIRSNSASSPIHDLDSCRKFV